MEKLEAMLYFIRKGVCELARDSAYYFTRRLKKDRTAELSKLETVKWVLESERHAIIHSNTTCLCCEELQDISLSVTEILGHDCDDVYGREDLIVDSSRYDDWVLDSTCASYEEWEQRIYGISRQIRVTIKKSEACNFVFDIIKKNVPCELVYALKFYQKECDLKFGVRFDQVKCEQEYRILTERHEGCDLSYDVYAQLKSCNLSYEIIAKAVECGYSWSINSIDKCPEVIINAKAYSLNDIDLSDIDMDHNLVSCNINLNELNKRLKVSYSGSS